ncbi:MAG: hypothetical protein WCS85_05240 [Candidatus Peribacteraceae bacterium]
MEILQFPHEEKPGESAASLTLRAIVRIQGERYIGTFRRNGTPEPQEQDLITLDPLPEQASV